MLCAFLIGALAVPQDQPTSRATHRLEGWAVQVDERLVHGAQKALGNQALKLLQAQLVGIARALPADKLSRLRRVQIVLDLRCGDLASPQYHPSAQWLREHGYPASLAKAVHIPGASYFAGSSFQSTQPWAVMHELAHAYHDQVLGFENAEVKAAWQAWSEKHKDERVLHAGGRDQKHYAHTNQMEFFAEMTESYFGVNDFFPFVRAEMQRSDPDVYELMKKTWGRL